MSELTDASVLQILRLRAALLAAIRLFFEQRGFVEVETPAIVPSPGLDVHLSAFEVRDSENRPVGWLATSPEYQMKRLLSAGAERIFQICRSYRAEEHGRHHEREFTMLEWYRADATSDDVIRDTEELLAFVAGAIDQPAPELQTRWERITVGDAVQLHASVTLASLLDDEERFFRVWAEDVQPRLGTERPIVVTDWPASMASTTSGRSMRFRTFAAGTRWW